MPKEPANTGGPEGKQEFDTESLLLFLSILTLLLFRVVGRL